MKDKMAGIETVETYEPSEIRGYSGIFESIPCTLLEGENLSKGQVLGIIPTIGKYANYDDTKVASATTPAAGGSNVGDGTMSAVTVDNAVTLTEDWTLTCTAEAADAGTFSVVGSVSGNVGDATVGVEFSDDDGKITFTISDGAEDFDVDDTFTFSTTRDEGSEAKGILVGDTDATDGDEAASMYVRGNFVESLLTGLDANGKSDLNGKSAGIYFIM